MGRELGAAGPAIVGFYHFLTTSPYSEFSTPAQLTEVDQDFLRISWACKMLQWTIYREAEA